MNISFLTIFLFFSTCNEKNQVEGKIIDVRKDWALNNWGSSTLVWRYKYEFNVNNETYKDYFIESTKNRKIEKGSKLLIEFSKKNPKENKVIKKIKLIYDNPLKD
jgi:hypothetical protein